MKKKVKNGIHPFKSAKDVIPSNPAVMLVDPKYPHNVAATIRACSCYDVNQIWITGKRMANEVWKMNRIPREERMRGYKDVDFILEDRPFDYFPDGTIPVAVELLPGSENIYGFEHPENAVYVFGPEDGTISQMVRRFCHRRIFIPTRHCINLSAAVYLVLNDRKLKNYLKGKEEPETIGDALNEQRGWSSDDSEFWSEV